MKKAVMYNGPRHVRGSPSDWVIVCPRSPVAIWRRKNPTAPDQLEELRVSGLPSAHDMTKMFDTEAAVRGHVH